MPFEADLEYSKDNFVKNPDKLKTKNGNSEFRPGAGSLSMERCFVEVLTRAGGIWSNSSLVGASSSTASCDLPQAPSASLSNSAQNINATTLLYPGHEYTTDLLLRQFTPSALPTDISWTKLSPSAFFTVASHYLVRAHRRALPPGQKLSTLPTTLEREIAVNPNYRMLKRRGEMLGNGLRVWYEFGAKTLIPDREEEDETTVMMEAPRTSAAKNESVFTTVYSQDLDAIVSQLRNGTLTPAAAADRLSSLPTKLDETIIARRPIPSTLPSHKNVYLGVVALAILGSRPCAVTEGDARVMGMSEPVEGVDGLLISRGRVSLFFYGQ